MEQYKPFDAGDYLKKQLGLQPEKPELPEQERKEVAGSMTTGKMQEVGEMLSRMDMEAFLGQRMGNYASEKEQIKKEQDLIMEFLSAKKNLDSHTFDSNTKEKLYRDIFEKSWKPKLEKAFNKTSEELKELEIIRKGKKEFDNLSEEEKSRFSYLSGRNTIIGYIRFLSGGLQKLE